jgi:hypothetical protein
MRSIESYAVVSTKVPGWPNFLFADNPGVGRFSQRGITLRSVAHGVRSVPPMLCMVVGWRFLRYDRFLRKADCGTQL